MTTRKSPFSRLPLWGWAFCLSALLTAGVYLALGWWPFGGGTLLTGDLNGQYLAFITDFFRQLKQGGLFYSFGKLAGGSTLGLFAYYVNSPFNLIYLLAPEAWMPQATQLIFLLRTGVTAAAFCWYLQRRTGRAEPLLVLLAQGYALCGYTMAYSQNIIWMDLVWLLPLILDGLDALLDTGRHWRFTLLLALGILLNFYIGWMVCLFCLLYFLARFWEQPRPKGLFPRRFGLFAASGVMAAGSTALLLVPVLLEVSETKGSLLAYQFSTALQFPLAQLPYRLFFGDFFWSDVTGTLPNLYCGMAAAALALVYFFGDAPRRQKLAWGGLLALLALSFWVEGLDVIWHGFNTPVWFPCRYSFVFSAVVLLLAARALCRGPQPRRALLGAGAVCLVWLIGYPLHAGAEFSALKLAVALAACLSALALGWVRLGGKAARPAWLRRAAAGAFALVLAGELAANSAITLRKFENYSVTDFDGFYDQATDALEAIRAQDDGLYRVERNFLHTLNDPMLMGYWGISHYSSTKASTAKELLEQLGYIGYSTYGWGSTAVADSLLGIRYLYSDGSRPAPAHYQARPELSGGYAVYENPYALPLAYLGDAAVLAVDPALGDSDTFALQNQILTALLPGSTAPLAAAQPSFETNEKGTMTLRFAAPTSGPCYLAIPNTDNLQPIDVVVNGVLYAQYFEAESLGGPICLGRFEAGETVELTLGFLDSPEYRAQVQVYCLDEAALAESTAQLRAAAPADLDMREGGHITLTAQAGAGQVLVLPVAWEEGWQATVNGQAATVEPLLGGFMAIRLPQGECQVSLTYHHAGVGLGLGISLAFWLAGLAWLAWERKRPAAGEG